jgi:hypothetical protein
LLAFTKYPKKSATSESILTRRPSIQYAPVLAREIRAINLIEVGAQSAKKNGENNATKTIRQNQTPKWNLRAL